MALTKVSRGLLSTGIVDNSNATAITIDSSENVGVGTSSPRSILDLDGGSETQLRLQTTNSGSTTSDGLLVSLDSSANAKAYIWSYENAEMLFGTNATERMRIDSSGNVGIGGNPIGGARLALSKSAGGDVLILTNSSSADLIVNCTSGVTRISPSTGVLALGTGNVEKIRIDSSGNLLVGTASTSYENSMGTAISVAQGYVIQNHVLGTGTGAKYTYFSYNAGEIGSITQSGTTAVLYNTTSDQRLKENIADADDAGSKIDAIQVRKFDWIADGSHQDYGMVAQELLEVAPEAVSAPEDPEDMMGVDYSKLVPMLVKEIQSLRTRVQELENT